MYTCASCTVHACCDGTREKMPKNCPMREEEAMSASFREYEDAANRAFFMAASEIEALGYCEWPRVRETIEFCRRMGYHKIGLAFCMGLSNEARILAGLLRESGLEVVSLICKLGSNPKETIGIPRELKVYPDRYEAMCNPIGQAQFLNRQGTELNIVLGLCVGHDSMFYKYSDALVTTLVVKDRVLAHNPAGALYCAEGYLRNKLIPPDDNH